MDCNKSNREIAIVTVVGGLESQMENYAFFIHVREHTQKECIIDTSPFYFKKMWNGYELNRVFGIDDENLMNYVSDKRIKTYSNYLELEIDTLYRITGNRDIIRYDRGIPTQIIADNHRTLTRTKKKILRIPKKILWKLKVITGQIEKKGGVREEDFDSTPDCYPDDYLVSNGMNVLYDEFCMGDDQYLPDWDNLKKVYTFPEFEDEKNIDIAKRMYNSESVSVHIRRSDHMYDNGNLFDRGFFRKAIEYIRAHTDKPEFYFFSEEIDWCQQHLMDFGLSMSDNVTFVNWNTGSESFRDMQLMTYCRHNIIPVSGFSWWGAKLSQWQEQDKIIIAPMKCWGKSTVVL